MSPGRIAHAWRAAKASRVPITLALAGATLLTACASAPPRGTNTLPPVAVPMPEPTPLPVQPTPAPEADAVAALAAATALSQVGRPYRYGGATPAGFDCSGLVYYAYLQAGVEVPRSSEQQFLAAAALPLQELRRGDLLFFRIDGKISHVAIYLDAGQFVHAPSSGKTVQLGSMDVAYYRSHLVSIGRVARPQ